MFTGYVYYSRKKYKLVSKSKVIINSNTPVGESAEYYERMPYGGRREFYPIFEVIDNKIVHCYMAGYYHEVKQWLYKVPSELRLFLVHNKICIPLTCGVTETSLIIS